MSEQAEGAGIVTRRRRTFTIVYDDQFVTGMSARAWGVYCYLLSRPDGWETRIGHLQSVFAEGRDAIATAVRELVTLNRLVKETYLADGLQRTRYVLDADGGHHRRSAPETDSQGPGTPAPGTPAPGNPPQVITEEPTTDSPNTEEEHPAAGAALFDLDERRSTRGDDEPAPTFADFWAAYPRREAKAAAERAWGKAVKRGIPPARIVAGAARYRDDANRVPQFTKHPTTWLNGGCWDDDPLPPRREAAVNEIVERGHWPGSFGMPDD